MSDINSQGLPPAYSGNQRTVGFTEAVKMAFDKYLQFTGRSSRSEYWWWVLFTSVLELFCGFIDGVLGTNINYTMLDQTQSIGIISSIVGLCLFIPSLAVCWRRLHDIGRAGGWYFICLVPFIGWIIVIYWFILPSERRENRFGQIPNCD